MNAIHATEPARNDEPPRLTILPGPVPSPAVPTLAVRLERRFGLGAMPEKRRALYTRLQTLVEARPEVETLIREAASQATGARHPDRYFCSAVVKKLRECHAYADL
jgi:hypothetical protein